ncbi:hypothetical protein NHX12_013620 [Muraenolepis orangiensis]|uniref:BZIP domain-containing protein n=1 Tax=Muraenolepis orangiensis TaxID=630683 RepID=A0A9Q0DDX6_9TELE|nr:hypothetical protein NHX12_013620 [Muraenolepis orangiensis]
MPPLFMERKSSSPGLTSGEELDSPTSGMGSPLAPGMRQGIAAGPVPRRRGTAGGQKKNKNRDAARKSRRRQTEKADELHAEHQCLERCNTALEKEIASLQAEVRRYAGMLERHQGVCLLFTPGLPSLLPTSTSSSTSSSSSSTSPSIAAATRHENRPRPSDSVTHAFALSTAPLSFMDTPQLCPPSSSSSSSPSSPSSSSSSSSVHLLLDHRPLPPLTSSRGRPASFAPLHPIPAPDVPPTSKSDRGSFERLAGASLPQRSRDLPSYPGRPVHESVGCGSAPGSIFTSAPSGPGPCGVFVPGPPPPPPLATSYQAERGAPAGPLSAGASGGSGGGAPPLFLSPLCDLSRDVSLSQLLQIDDWFLD